VVVVSNCTRRVCTECTQGLTFTCFRTILDDLEETIETQNITLSLPQEILLKVKQLAVKHQTSVSGLLAQTLERLVHQDSDAGNLTCVNCGFPDYLGRCLRKTSSETERRDESVGERVL
jgi:hypothetical protein